MPLPITQFARWRLSGFKQFTSCAYEPEPGNLRCLLRPTVTSKPVTDENGTSGIYK